MPENDQRMKENYRNRHIRLKGDTLSIGKLEAFLDAICDDFHIYDDYYGNIISCVTAAHDMLANIRPEDKDVDIYFNANKQGITFKVMVNDDFIDVARIHELVSKGIHTIGNDQWDEEVQKIFLINSLADKLVINNQDESMEIVFNVTGINDYMTDQRLQLLHNYYDRLVRVMKTIN